MTKEGLIRTVGWMNADLDPQWIVEAPEMEKCMEDFRSSHPEFANRSDDFVCGLDEFYKFVKEWAEKNLEPEPKPESPKDIKAEVFKAVEDIEKIPITAWDETWSAPALRLAAKIREYFLKADA